MGARIALALAALTLAWSTAGAALAANEESLCHTAGGVLPPLGSLLGTVDDTLDDAEVCPDAQEPEPPEPEEPEEPTTTRPERDATQQPGPTAGPTTPGTPTVDPVTGDAVAPVIELPTDDPAPVIVQQPITPSAADDENSVPLALAVGGAGIVGALAGRRWGRRVAERRGERVLEATLDLMPDGIIRVDPRGRITALNVAAAPFLSSSTAPVRGRMLWGVLAGALEDGAWVSRWVRATIDTGGATIAELGPERIPAAISIAPVPDVGAVCVVHDLRPERAVRRMKQEFLANVGHELRTPLTSALGFARMLRNQEITPERKASFVDAIVDACERLDRVVDLLLDVTAIEGGTVDIGSARLSPSECLTDLVGRWRAHVPSHVFDLKMAAALPTVRCNEALMKQALDELLDNAAKFSPDGGIVTVSADVAGKGSERVVRIRISDQGVGIAGDTLGRMLDDFEQGDPSATRSFGGLGIGLSFVRRVVELHGGSVDLISVRGAGTTVAVDLPAPVRARSRATGRTLAGAR